jgi:hypothetical protein
MARTVWKERQDSESAGRARSDVGCTATGSFQHLAGRRHVLASHQNCHSAAVVQARILLSSIVSGHDGKDSCGLQCAARKIGLHAGRKHSYRHKVHDGASLPHSAAPGSLSFSSGLLEVYVDPPVCLECRCIRAHLIRIVRGPSMPLAVSER